MQTHEDSDFIQHLRHDFMDRLQQRADQCVKDKSSEITGGKEGEKPLAVWRHKGMQVTHRPDDEQGILRISIGGIVEVPLHGKLPVHFEYCVIRGSVGQCIDLLERAIAALRQAP